MIRLLYISDAHEGINEEAVNGVLKSAAKNNPPLGITGLLVFGGGVFAQILEGPEQAVLRKYVQIATDMRHHNCRIVYITTTEERIFKNISMAALEALPMEMEHIAELDARRHETVSADAFTDLMRVFFSRIQALP
ncbi:sensor of blue-light using FAD [Polaromonas sp. CF318]|uniref:BLUF domain-containing protein n=1 Tax=Polaromonas sp. CF318 TaxID=1144318 RepID=UPI0002713C87|nr:BLUF domain-containing protein [Polaromonas sp. CF318]EJL89863.1 sensor of blue-light using FAD [Polaromonas sp. CF318]